MGFLWVPTGFPWVRHRKHKSRAFWHSVYLTLICSLHVLRSSHGTEKQVRDQAQHLNTSHYSKVQNPSGRFAPKAQLCSPQFRPKDGRRAWAERIRQSLHFKRFVEFCETRDCQGITAHIAQLKYLRIYSPGFWRGGWTRHVTRSTSVPVTPQQPQTT